MFGASPREGGEIPTKVDEAITNLPAFPLFRASTIRFVVVGRCCLYLGSSDGLL